MSENTEEGVGPEKDRGGPAVILKDTVKAFLQDDVIHWGASLAYYSLISLAPLLILAMLIFGQLVGAGEAEAWILEQVRLMAGPRGVEMARRVLEEASHPELGSLGAIVTIGILLFGATAVFRNLQAVLNRIWGVKSDRPILKGLLLTRITAFFMVMALGGILVVSVILSTTVSWAGPLLDPIQSIFPFLRIGEFITSVAILWLFVAATFQILPDAEVAWRDVWMGALVTALLLSVGKYAVAAFLARNAFASAYGAAGSLFLLLMWVYYSAQVFFLGAEFTQVWAHHHGRTIQPEKHAVRTEVVKVREEKEEDQRVDESDDPASSPAPPPQGEIQ